MHQDNPPSTAYIEAVLRLFERIGAGLPTHLQEPVRAILVGGAAVHTHTRSRVSKDVEAIFSHRLLLPQDLVVRYTDEAGQARTLAYDYNYFRDIALMHPDCEQDAIALQQVASYPLVLYVLAPLDLAVSKLARFQDIDRQDIASLARRGLLDGRALEDRAGEALSYYVGNDRWVRYNLTDAMKLIEQNRPANHGHPSRDTEA